MTFDSWMYGNPETVAIRKQEAAFRKLKQCKGCTHHQQIEIQGETLNRCDIKTYGTPNCQQFTTKRK
jgi:hypothetical protein